MDDQQPTFEELVEQFRQFSQEELANAMAYMTQQLGHATYTAFVLEARHQVMVNILLDAVDAYMAYEALFVSGIENHDPETIMEAAVRAHNGEQRMSKIYEYHKTKRANAVQQLPPPIPSTPTEDEAGSSIRGIDDILGFGFGGNDEAEC